MGKLFIILLFYLLFAIEINAQKIYILNWYDTIYFHIHNQSQIPHYLLTIPTKPGIYIVNGNSPSIRDFFRIDSNGRVYDCCFYNGIKKVYEKYDFYEKK